MLHAYSYKLPSLLLAASVIVEVATYKNHVLSVGNYTKIMY